MSAIEVAGRAWDSFDGYLFDIDGTLLQCTDAVHYFAFCETLKHTAGRDLTIDGVIAHGNVDVGILRDAFELAGVADDLWRPRLPDIQQAMVRYVRAHQHELLPSVLPYAREVLEHLQQKGAALGVATGNLREIGQLKLARAGLLEFFSIGGWSDAYEHRPDVFSNAVRLMRAANSNDSSICIVGDTPADVVAAQANEVPVIAVATGVYPKEQLEASRPDLCVSSFADLLYGVS